MKSYESKVGPSPTSGVHGRRVDWDTTTRKNAVWWQLEMTSGNAAGCKPRMPVTPKLARSWTRPGRILQRHFQRKHGAADTSSQTSGLWNGKGMSFHCLNLSSLWSFRFCNSRKRTPQS